MNKTIALAAIAALAMGSEQFGENELNVFKSIGNGLKKAGHFVAEHPQVITTAAKILAHDDEELFNIHSALHKVEDGAKKAGHYVAEHPEVINQAIQILKNFKHDDEELFNIHNIVHKTEEGVKKAEHYVYDHRHQIEQGAKKAVDYIQQHPEVVNKAIEIIKNLRHHDDEELFHLGKVVHNVAHAVGKVEHIAKDGMNLYKDVQTGNIAGAFNHGKAVVNDVKHIKHDDEELFNIHDAIHKAGEGVKKAEHYVWDHRQQIAEGAKKGYNYVQEHPETVQKAIEIIKKLSHHDDEELFNLDAFLNDAVKTFNDVRQKDRNYGNIVNDGIQLVKDIKQKKHDDEELFHIGKAIHNVAHAVGKVEHIAKDGMNLYKDVQTGNIAGAFNHGKAVVNDVKHIKHDDEELFNLDAFLNDAVKTYNDARQNPRNYGNLVNDGIQLVKDIKQKKHDDEELFHLGKVVHNVAHAVGKVEHIAKDGMNLYKDVQTGNIAGAFNHGKAVVNDVKNIKHDDEELFHLGKVVHNVAHAVGKVEHIAKDGMNLYKDVQTGNIAGAFNHGKAVVNDVKHIKHDDEELFHLGKAVHNVAHAVGKVEHIAKDGVNLYKDVKTGNIGGAINNGKALIHDVKNIKHDDEELFNLGTLINDGMNIYKDVKGKNYGGLVNDGIQTVKDVKKNLRHH